MLPLGIEPRSMPPGPPGAKTTPAAVTHLRHTTFQVGGRAGPSAGVHPTRP